MPRKPMQLLGTHLEGGGQLVRLAVGLSALKGIPIQITSIRGNRGGGGGLKLQHLRAVEWLAEACSADLEGAQKGSNSLVFEPNRIGKLKREVDIGSPGSIGLVFQAILPYLLFAGGAHTAPGEELKIRISGGTNVSKSPSIEYFQQVLLPTLGRIGLPRITAKLEKRGWTHGGTTMGSIMIGVTPLRPGETLQAWELTERGDISRIEAYALAPKTVRRQMEHDIKTVLKQEFEDVDDVTIEYEDSNNSKRFYLLLVAISSNGHRLGRDWLYDQKINLKTLDAIPSRLVKQVSSELRAEILHGGCVDEYMTDQLVVFQALAEGRCQVDFGRDEDGERTASSLHTQTAHWVAEKMLRVEWENGLCEGASFAAAV